MAISRLPTNNLRVRRILEQSARLICQYGFEATSMQQIADACGLTKAGIYHYVKTKEGLLVAIMHYGMDLFEEEVYRQVVNIQDPVERLRMTMIRNIKLTLSRKEVAIILNENRAMSRSALRDLNVRRRQYVTLLESAFREAIERRQIRPIDPTVAAFSFLGITLWTPNLYRADGRLSMQQLAETAFDQFFHGLALN